MRNAVAMGALFIIGIFCLLVFIPGFTLITFDLYVIPVRWHRLFLRAIFLSYLPYAAIASIYFVLIMKRWERAGRWPYRQAS